MYNILICDDEKDIVNALKIYLSDPSYTIFEAYDGAEALALVKNEDIHLVLTDIMMPVRDGISFVSELRKTSNIPVILLSAKSEDTDKILGLNIGADDYITKPFGSSELLARVRAALRNSHQMYAANIENEKFVLNDMVIDYSARQVFIKGEEVKLTQTEYNIVSLLSEHCGKMMTYSAIIKGIWGYPDEGSIKKLQVNMANIRKKLGAKPGVRGYIINELGVGYRMNSEKA